MQDLFLTLGCENVLENHIKKGQNLVSAVYIDYVSHHMGFRENKLSSFETILTLHNPFHNMCRYCFQDTVQTIAQQVHLKPNNDKEKK